MDILLIQLIISNFFWGVSLSACVSTPSFESDWYPIEAQSSHSSEVVIPHYLNEVPIKVLAEVRVFNGSEFYIFPAFGSGHRDSSEVEVYGGIVYTYNDQEVRLFAPNAKNDNDQGLAIYTGQPNSWKGHGNITRQYSSAEVRVRVWKSEDMFGYSFISEELPINTLNESESFYEISHNLLYYPDHVNIQVQHLNGYYSDASGSTSNIEYCRGSSAMGGVIYGYNDTHIRVWAPFALNDSCSQIGIISLLDGWGNNTFGLNKIGKFRVYAWSFPGSARIQRITLNSTDIYSFIFPIDYQERILNRTWVTVQVQAKDGPNANFRFPAVGSVSNDGGIGQFGGLVYGYSDAEVVLWVADDNDKGAILNMKWGNVDLHQKSKNVEVIISIWNLTTEEEVRCHLSSQRSNSAYTMYSEMTYLEQISMDCNSGYELTSGNTDYLLCKRDCKITYPSCREKNCSSLDAVSNADIIRSGVTYQSVVEYQCHYGYKHTSGTLIRTCNIGPQWSGSTPVCTAITCPISDSEIPNAEKNISGNMLDDVANYTCAYGYRYVYGSSWRQCQSNGTWSGTPMYCERIICPEYAKSSANAKVDINGSYYDDVVRYTCISGYRLVSGNISRTCLENATWSGEPPNCEAITCQDDSVMVTGTVIVSMTGMSYNDVVSYQCRENYNLVIGSLHRICQSDGNWGNNTPVCQEVSASGNKSSVTSEQIAALKISIKNTSNYRRSLISVYESRPSAVAIGTVGTFIIILVASVLFLPDLPKIYMDIRNHWNIDLLRYLCKRYIVQKN